MAKRPARSLSEHVSRNYMEIRDARHLNAAEVSARTRPYGELGKSLLSRLLDGASDTRLDQRAPVDLRVSQLIALALALETSPTELLRPRGTRVQLSTLFPAEHPKASVGAAIFTRWLRGRTGLEAPRDDDDTLADIYSYVFDAYEYALSGQPGGVRYQRERIEQWLDAQEQAAKGREMSRLRADDLGL